MKGELVFHLLFPIIVALEANNKCEEFGVCSQKCEIIRNTYKCSCIPGFQLNLKDNSSCTLKGK